MINATFEYCHDFTGDGFDDVKVTLALDPSSNSGTEDLIGVAFDVNSIQNLEVVDIQRATANGTLSTFTPTVVIGEDQVSDGGPKDPGFNTSGGNLGEDGEPYDVGIKVSDQGSGEGIVQSFSFVLTTPGANIDAEALLDTTDWWVRLQSTDGGEGSAKMALFNLDLPACGGNGGNCFEGLTPGYWKTHGPEAPGGQMNDWDNITGRPVFGPGALSYEQLIFGTSNPSIDWTVPGGRTPVIKGDLTVYEALDIGGGGANALARQSMAAILNARDEDVTYFATEAEIIGWTSSVLAGGTAIINGTSYNLDGLKNLFEANNELGLDTCVA